MGNCVNCGATVGGHTCTYCGTKKYSAKVQRKTVYSNMGDYQNLKDTILVGNMNEVDGCTNCEIRGNMNDISNACPDTVVVGNMNDISRR